MLWRLSVSFHDRFTLQRILAYDPSQPPGLMRRESEDAETDRRDA
jgi:hypothetical protein